MYLSEHDVLDNNDRRHIKQLLSSKKLCKHCFRPFRKGYKLKRWQVILEALSAGTFIILNKNLDWKIIEKKGFGILIKFDYKNLKEAVEIIEKKKEKINNINFRKKQLNFIKKKYNWNYIAQEYLSEYF